MKHYPFLTIISQLGIGVAGSTCLALQTYPLIDQQRTTVTISQTEQNRIAVLNDRIQQVFGADGAFDVESDEEAGQIFLLATKSRFSLSDKPLKPMTMTIITETGLTQDLKLIPQDIEAQSILFKPAFSQGEVTQEKAEHLRQVITLFKAMVKNEELAGYIKVSLENKSSQPSQQASSRFANYNTLKVGEIAHYISKKYEGKIYTLHHQGTQDLFLKESDFLQTEDYAVSLSKRRIHKGETIILYVITQGHTQEHTRRGQ